MNLKHFGFDLLVHMQNRTKSIRKIFKKMNIKPIKTENDYRLALKRLDEIFDAKAGSENGNEF